MESSESDLELISSLHNGSVLLPSSDRSRSICLILIILVVMCTFHFLLLTTCRFLFKNDEQLESKVIKSSYQATNLLINLLLGLYGFYTWMTSVPRMSTVIVTSKIADFNEFISFALLQIGYNLWSIPMGLWVVGESKAMLAHHLATLCVASISCFAKCGFRYYTPYFFGCIEISSVPLTVINFFKGNKEWAAKKNGQFNCLLKNSKIVFAALFLLTRVILWTPQMYDVLRASIMLCSTCTTIFCWLTIGSFSISAMFLTVLQYYWGSLVAKGVWLMFSGRNKKKIH